MTSETELERVQRENETLRKVVVDLHWLARRSADGRQRDAPSLFNDHVWTLLALGVPLNATGDRTIWAADDNPRCMDVTPEQMGPEWTHDQNTIQDVGNRAERMRLCAEAAERELTELKEQVQA